jgi:hypothetical protein
VFVCVVFFSTDRAHLFLFFRKACFHPLLTH